jgi:hypothetical protein
MVFLLQRHRGFPVLKPRQIGDDDTTTALGKAQILAYVTQTLSPTPWLSPLCELVEISADGVVFFLLFFSSFFLHSCGYHGWRFVAVSLYILSYIVLTLPSPAATFSTASWRRRPASRTRSRVSRMKTTASSPFESKRTRTASSSSTWTSAPSSLYSAF